MQIEESENVIRNSADFAGGARAALQHDYNKIIEVWFPFFVFLFDIIWILCLMEKGGFILKNWEKSLKTSLLNKFWICAITWVKSGKFTLGNVNHYFLC